MKINEFVGLITRLFLARRKIDRCEAKYCFTAWLARHSGFRLSHCNLSWIEGNTSSTFMDTPGRPIKMNEGLADQLERLVVDLANGQGLVVVRC